MDDGDRPLILLDVDGVINAQASSAERGHRCFHDGWEQVKVYPSFNNWLRIFYNPAIGPMIRELARETGAELAWASMWEDWANKCIGPLLGLPVLPYAPAVDGRYTTGFKADTVVPWTQGRPFVWFEDEPGEIAQMTLRAQGQLHLPVHVQEYHGLTEADIGLARRWLLDRQARKTQREENADAAGD
jgi:hypothetical protein